MVPQWIVNNLGQTVRTKGIYDDGLRTWQAGEPLTLISIVAWEGETFATGIFTKDPQGSEENFAFDEIEP